VGKQNEEKLPDQESPAFKESTKNDQISTTANQCSFGELLKMLPAQQFYKPIPVLTKTVEPSPQVIPVTQEK
jgi:hypothetical protein